PISQRLMPARVDGRDLKELLDQPGVVLEALVKQRMRSPSPEAAGDDSNRLRLLEARLDKAIALAAGVSLTIHPSDSVLVPGSNTKFTVNLTNSGEQPIEIHSLSFNSWCENSRLDMADQLVADTETTATVEKTI